MAKILRCDRPHCKSETPLDDSKDWRVIEQCHVSTANGDGGAMIVSAALCPACVYAIDAMLWPKEAEALAAKSKPAAVDA